LKPYYEKNRIFWRDRNEKMANNIIEYIQEYPGKRVVVLTGLFHKHYLMDLLYQAQQRDLFKLVEFYDRMLYGNSRE
jgi:pheromone shutdown protein TraB